MLTSNRFFFLQKVSSNTCFIYSILGFAFFGKTTKIKSTFHLSPMSESKDVKTLLEIWVSFEVYDVLSVFSHYSGLWFPNSILSLEKPDTKCRSEFKEAKTIHDTIVGKKTKNKKKTISVGDLIREYCLKVYMLVYLCNTHTHARTRTRTHTHIYIYIYIYTYFYTYKTLCKTYHIKQI